MKLDCCNKLVISCKDFGTPKNPEVLEDSPTSTSDEEISLLCYFSGIVISSSAVQF